MACQRCNSERVALINGKTSDMCQFKCQADGVDHIGYVPQLPGFGGGDYLVMHVCMECGTVQGTFPLTREDVQEACGIEEEE